MTDRSSIRGGRPRGEIRQALGQAAAALVQAQGGATWRDLAVQACVGYAKAREVVRDMARAGELQAVGEVRVEHARRPMVRYAPGAAASRVGGWSATQYGAPLSGVLSAWVR